jgi:hypothetical protein
MMEEGIPSGFRIIAGVLNAVDELRMKRLVFRVSKGRAIPSFFDYEQPLNTKITVIFQLIRIKKKYSQYSFKAEMKV